MSIKDFLEDAEDVFGKGPGDGGEQETKETKEEPDPMKDVLARLQAAEERAARAEGRVEELSRGVNRPGPEREPEPEVQFTREDFIDDPDGFNDKLNSYMQRKAAPIVQSLLQLQAQNAMRDAIARHPYLQTYEKEATEILRGTPVAELGNARTWDTVAMMIKDRHYDEIRAKGKSAGPPDTVRSRNDPPDDGPRELTPDEKFVARRLGMTPEQYQKNKEAYNAQQQR